MKNAPVIEPAWPPKPPQASFPPGTPCMLYSSVSQVTLAGGDRLPDTSELQCPYDGPMLLDEMRFNVTPNTATNALCPISDLQVKLALDGKELTNGFVSLWALAPVYDFLGSEFNTDAQSYIVSGILSQIYACRFTLPAPLFLRPGQTVVATFRRKNYGLYANDDTTYLPRIDISYAGRLLPANTPAPATIALPYVTGIISNNSASTTPSTANLIAAEDSFLNKFDKPLYIARFCGRRVLSAASIPEWYDGNPGFGFTIASSANAGAQVRVVGPDGLDCVRGFQDFNTVFGGNRRAWNVGTWLPPSKGFTFHFRECTFVTVNMIGYRAEAI